MTEESYANRPESVREIRAQKNHNSADWAPRDCLVHILRLIDRGEIAPANIVVIVDQEVGDQTAVDRFFAGPGTRLHKNGMLLDALTAG